MEKYVPYEKLSKKKQRELNRQRRGTWGDCNPVTRKPENPRAYQRQKARSWRRNSNGVPVFYSSGANPFIIAPTSLLYKPGRRMLRRSTKRHWARVCWKSASISAMQSVLYR